MSSDGVFLSVLKGKKWVIYLIVNPHFFLLAPHFLDERSALFLIHFNRLLKNDFMIFLSITLPNPVGVFFHGASLCVISISPTAL